MTEPGRIYPAWLFLIDGQVWIDMLDHRNLLAHTYDSAVFEEAVQALAARYLPALNAMHEFFATQNA